MVLFRKIIVNSRLLARITYIKYKCRINNPKNMKRFVLVCLFLIIPFAVSAQINKIKLYLGNSEKNPQSEDCGKVFAVSRDIPKTKAVAKATLQELFKGVTKEEKAKNYESLFSNESSSILIGINIRSGAAYVNLRNSIRESVSAASTSCGRDMFFAQVEETLKQFSSIKKVFFAIEGKPADFYDWMEIDKCPKELGKCSGKNFR